MRRTLVALVTTAVAVATFTACGGVKGSEATSGAEIYGDSCAACHGADGQGGVGPELGNGAVVESFPDEADQLAVVTNGQGTMPSFEGTLTEAQIAAVVGYTRDDLGR